MQGVNVQKVVWLLLTMFNSSEESLTLHKYKRGFKTKYIEEYGYIRTVFGH